MKAARPIVWPEPLLFRGEFVPTQPAVGSDNVWYRQYKYVHRPHSTGISFVKAQAIEAFKLQLQLQLRQHPATSEVAKHVIHGPHFNLRHDHQLNLSPAKKTITGNFQLFAMSEKTTPQGPFHPAGSCLPPSLTTVCVCSPEILTAATTTRPIVSSERRGRGGAGHVRRRRVEAQLRQAPELEQGGPEARPADEGRRGRQDGARVHREDVLTAHGPRPATKCQSVGAGKLEVGTERNGMRLGEWVTDKTWNRERTRMTCHTRQYAWTTRTKGHHERTLTEYT